jgi:hypothetical protein
VPLFPAQPLAYFVSERAQRPHYSLTDCKQNSGCCDAVAVIVSSVAW